MSGRIPKTFIDNLVAQADIVDVISQYIDIKKKGSNYTACCPFHNEKSPSFSVSPSKQFYYCFGCGAHGDAIGFVKEYNNLSFVEAIEELARHLGVDVPREIEEDSQTARKRNEYQKMYALLEKAASFFQQQLRQSEAKSAVEYCKMRGLTGKIAKTYGVGFVPKGWDNLNLLLNKDSKQTELLLTVGLLTRNDKGRTYDRFRHRLMFPIRDRRGRVVGFGGRVIDANDQPKYLNSPETPVFHKGKELYGLYEIKQSQKTLDCIIVVEGYMDVIALAQAGIPNAVATMGTATTVDHLRVLFKETEQVVFCFDGDRAGKQAAWRALETTLPLMTGEYEVKFLFLPEGEDPDSLVRKENVDTFKQRIETALPLGEFLFTALAGQVDLNRADGRAKYITKVLPFLRPMPAGSMKTVMLNALAERCHVPVNQIANQLMGGKPAQDETVVAKQSTKLSYAAKAIHYLISQPELMRSLSIPKWVTDDKDILLLMDVMQFVLDHNPETSGAIIGQWKRKKPTESEKLAQLADVKLDASRTFSQQEFVDLMNKIEQDFQSRMLDKLFEKSRHYALSPSEKDKITQLLRKVKNI